MGTHGYLSVTEHKFGESLAPMLWILVASSPHTWDMAAAILTSLESGISPPILSLISCHENFSSSHYHGIFWSCCPHPLSLTTSSLMVKQMPSVTSKGFNHQNHQIALVTVSHQNLKLPRHHLEQLKVPHPQWLKTLSKVPHHHSSEPLS